MKVFTTSIQRVCIYANLIYSTFSEFYIVFREIFVTITLVEINARDKMRSRDKSLDIANI